MHTHTYTHGSIGPTNATDWRPISDDTILDLVAEGRLPPAKLAEYIAQGRVSADMVISRIDWSDMATGAQTLKLYYAVLFL